MTSHTQSIAWMQLALLGAAFLAAALTLEGLLLLWHQTRSPAVQRLRKRLKAWLPEAELASNTAGGVSSSPTWLWLMQTGSKWTPPSLMGLSAVLAFLGLLMGAWSLQTWSNAPVGAGAWPLWLGVLIVACALGAVPWVVLAVQRERRLKQMVVQLPDVLDLMARAMRSGHAFSTAVQMVADEGPVPLAQEFARLSEQIGYGRDPDEAFEELAQRVPQDDIRFFVMAVRLQRQTGGQLTEVLGNIAELVRQRLRLLDKVRVLSAEGRLSAQVLAALPVVTAGVMIMIRPEFMATLWTDPLGVRMLVAASLLMAVGGVWLSRLTHLRV